MIAPSPARVPASAPDAPHVVVVGGGLGALRVLQRLRRSHDGPVTLVTAEAHLPYDRPPLSKQLLASTEPVTAPPALVSQADLAALGCDVLSGTPATGLDTEARRVRLADGRELGYDVAVVATGARPRVPAGLERSLVLRTWEDLQALRAAADRARHATVVGAGVLGLEVAASLRARGMAVTVLEAGARPLARVLPAKVAEAVVALHREHGVELRTGCAVTRLEGTATAPVLVLDDGEELRTDLVVTAAGSVPEVAWLEGSGLALDDGVLVEATGTTSDPAVLAVGDVTRPRGREGRPAGPRREHWTGAVDDAAVVARNVLRPAADRVGGTEPAYFWSDQYDVKVQGLGSYAAEDEVHLLHGDPREHSALLACVRDDVVTGVVGLRQPAAVNRCRSHVVRGATLAELRDARPWERPARPAPA